MGWDILIYARKQEVEDRIFQRWLHHQEINYEEFKNQILPPKVQIQNEKEILSHQEEILKRFGGEK